MIGTFDAAIAVRIVGACREFFCAEYFVHGCGELSAKLRSVVGQEDGWASPKRGVLVHQNVGSAFCSGFSYGDSEQPQAIIGKGPK